ncbi:MAG: glycosyltransferase family 2 protein [Oscillospiraceae bacterium]|jgi:hypothetical protein|nr:glycosyltransferase family 2 protein [Oscillospiraceae bacterium]
MAKKMIICGYCRVKNEADIIESFCRWNLTYLDALIIWDDNSSDRTVEIIQFLVDEGLSIELLHLTKEEQIHYEFDINDIMSLNERCKYIFQKYNADWVVPLDADEFLCCEGDTDVRLELEKLDENVQYSIYWRTGIFSHDPDDSTIFLPNYFKEYRDPSYEMFSKVLLSRTLVEKWGAMLYAGKHQLVFQGNTGSSSVPPSITHNTLCLAHYPIRSITHTLIKVICAQIKNFSYDGETTFHYKRIYDEIKSEGTRISAKMVRQFSLEYALLPQQMTESVITVKQPSDVLGSDFLSDNLRLKYTDYSESNYLGTILIFIEQIIEKLKCKNKEVINETSGMLQEMKTLFDDLYKVNLDLRKQIEQGNS